MPSGLGGVKVLGRDVFSVSLVVGPTFLESFN